MKYIGIFTTLSLIAVAVAANGAASLQQSFKIDGAVMRPIRHLSPLGMNRGVGARSARQATRCQRRRPSHRSHYRRDVQLALVGAGLDLQTTF